MSRAQANLEHRVAALEADMARLKVSKPWWEQIAGTFANDPVYLEAMRLGRQYRESLRPPSQRKSKGKNGRSRHRSR
jgi:hypothetical protein